MNDISEDISQENLIVNDLSLLEKQQLEESAQSSSFYAPEERNLLESSPAAPTQTQSLISIEPATTDAKGVPSDPGVISGNFWEQWHHTGEHGLNAMAVWDDYTGEGVRVGILDDGFNYNHSELSGNFRTDLDYDVLGNDTNSINDFGDNHGTYVAQILAGDDNGSRTVGVAFDADIVGIRRGFDAQSSTQDTVDAFEYALANDFDVMNNSWGMDLAFADNTKVDFIGTDTSAVTAAIENLAELGREGLGTNVVFSAGNNRQSGQSANYKNYQNSPYTITVGAIKEDGTFADFSEAGANLLVSAAGDSLYVANPTDTNSANIISGTSFAAPAVSGVVALMLEANADLGYRDVQEILAMSSRQTDANGTGWAGEGWQTNGATNWNGGGMHFSHDYGFGNVDALAAVRMAETWTLQQTHSNMTVIPPVSSAPALSIPSVGTITTTIDVVQDISIEHVLIDLDISHSRAGDLVVTLTSPDGTDSVLMYHVENGAYTARYGITGVEFEFSSTAHWGESSAGEWTLTVTDETGGNAGTLNDWSLEFLGSAQSNDDLYVYTNEYAGSEGSRTILSDVDGGIDTINAAAVSGDTTIDLNFGGTIANTIFIIDAGTVIENVYTGDGNDTLTGNVVDNDINSGRGDDLINGSAGDDTIDGAQGNDTLSYDFNILDFLIDLVDSTTVALTHVAQSFVDTISNIENFIFDGASYTRAQLESYVEDGGQGEFIESKITIAGIYSGRDNITSTEVGTVNYTGEELGDGDNDNVILTVTRTNDSLFATAVDPLIGGLKSIVNSDVELSSIAFNGFQSVRVTHSDGINDLNADISNAVSGKFLSGNGNDTVDITTTDLFDLNGFWKINTGAGDDDVTISGNINSMVSVIYLGSGNDTLSVTSNSNDRIYGEGGDDIINAGSGNNVVRGGEGNDTITTLDGNDNIRGNEGDDIINAGAGRDLVKGGEGDDIIRGGDDGDNLLGEAGDDTIYGDHGNDRIRGNEGNDTLHGGEGNDRIYGEGGNNILYGDAGFDALYGGLGDDVVYGGADNDRLYGQAGADNLYGDAGNDVIDGGEGNDVIHGGDGLDTLKGFRGDDTIYGDAGNDRLYGDNGNDVLNGGDGDDYLYAGKGIDVLIGGAGADRLYGGQFQDTFGLTDLGTGVDRIYNFTLGEDILNITDLLTGYDHGVDDLNDFVQLLDLGNGTTDLRINADGDNGGSYGRVALIYTDLGGAGVDDLTANGSLVADQLL